MAAMKLDTFVEVLPHNALMTPLGRLAGAGYIHRKTGYLRWRVLGSYALVYVLEGQGRYQDASGSACEVGAGDLIVIFPELAHRYGPGRRGEWSEFHVIFEGPAFDLWRGAGLLDAARPVTRLGPVGEWGERLLAVADGSPPQTVAVSRLLTLLSEVAATRGEQATPARLPWLDQAWHLLGSELSQELSPTDVAARLGLSYETFRKAFEKQVGVSPARYRSDRRLGAAQALLLHTQMSGRQIADSLGFRDEFYFSKRFKQHTGLSPREYRKQKSQPRPALEVPV